MSQDYPKADSYDLKKKKEKKNCFVVNCSWTVINLAYRPAYVGQKTMPCNPGETKSGIQMLQAAEFQEMWPQHRFEILFQIIT